MYASKRGRSIKRLAKELRWIKQKYPTAIIPDDLGEIVVIVVSVPSLQRTGGSITAVITVPIEYPFKEPEVAVMGYQVSSIKTWRSTETLSDLMTSLFKDVRNAEASPDFRKPEGVYEKGERFTVQNSSEPIVVGTQVNPIGVRLPLDTLQQMIVATGDPGIVLTLVPTVFPNVQWRDVLRWSLPEYYQFLNGELPDFMEAAADTDNLRWKSLTLWLTFLNRRTLVYLESIGKINGITKDPVAGNYRMDRAVDRETGEILTRQQVAVKFLGAQSGMLLDWSNPELDIPYFKRTYASTSPTAGRTLLGDMPLDRRPAKWTVMLKQLMLFFSKKRIRSSRLSNALKAAPYPRSGGTQAGRDQGPITIGSNTCVTCGNPTQLQCPCCKRVFCNRACQELMH